MLHYLEKLVHGMNGLLLFLGGVCLVAMIGLTSANIALRAVWAPVTGTYELMAYAGALAVAFALAPTQSRRGHIAVDVLVNRFPHPVRRLLKGFNDLVCTVFLFVIAVQLARKAAGFWRTGELSETLRIGFAPVTLAVALGCAAMALVSLLGLLRNLASGDGVRR
ncbi:MAG: TRAP transporter small permease [Desulfobacterales bacterium]